MVEYKEFRVGDLFDVKSTKKTIHKNMIEPSDWRGQHPYITRTTQNNGLSGYIDYDEDFLNDANTISLGLDTYTLSYQADPYFTGNKVKVLHLKDHTLNSRIAMYLISVYNRMFEGYDWGTGINQQAIVNMKLSIPTTITGQPDFDFMENYIKEVEQKHIKKLESDLDTRTENLLTVIGREDLISDPDGLAAVVAAGFDSTGVDYAEFRVGDLFDKAQTRYLGEGKAKDALLRGPISSGEHTLPITYAKIEDNGIMYWGDPDEWEYAENVIGVVYNGAVSAGLVYPHKKAAVLAESYLLKLKIDNGHLPFAVYKYMAAVLGKSTYQIYSREFLATWSGKVENDVITLPITPSGQPDFDFMAQYIAYIELKYTHTDKMDESERIDLMVQLAQQQTP